MKKLFISLLILISINTTFAQKYDFNEVGQFLKNASPGLKGCSLLLKKDGKVIYKKGFNGIKNDTPVKIMSASKWLTAAVILSLVDDKLIKLDDPVSKYLPKFKDRKGEVTIRQLLSHTSGIDQSLSFYDRSPKNLRIAIEYIAQNVKMISQPGTEFYYGGVNYMIVGRISEIVTGKDWETIFQERIAEPCDMVNTNFGYSKIPDVAAGAYSTASDYINFLTMILNNGKFKNIVVLTHEAVKEMMRDHVGKLPLVFRMYDEITKSFDISHYGLGIWIEKIETGTGKALEISSQGYYGFSPWIDFNNRLCGVLSVKNELKNVMPVYIQLKNLISEKLKSSVMLP